MTFALVAALWVWAAVAIGFTVTAMVKVRRTEALRRTRDDVVALVRPVDAPTPVELQNLRAVPSGVQQYVLSPVPGSGDSWLMSDPHGFNRKLGHVHAALKHLGSTQPVLIVDADVEVDDALVSSLLAGLERGHALAWAAPAPQSSGVERGLLVQSTHSFEVLDAISPGASPLCGKAMALSPAALDALRALPDCVGEDLELSEALHRKGLTTTLVGRARLPGRRSVTASFARFTRWMQVLRAHRPALFPSIPFLFAATPLLLVAAVTVDDWVLRALVATLMVARLFLATSLEQRPSAWWLAGEALLLVSWLNALMLGSRVVWRGRVLHIGAGGQLVESPE